MSEERLKIAVFIDFDNIEIGIRTTLSRRFDVHAVLEAVKERGEVVTKVAYGNWKRADDYSRTLTEHAVQMVQRNLTPGGDKNGADINLALDALEMAFTRDHINAFVIVGGDSDFIALVEKLKQYDKKVFIVGGRAFTSIILQKNCHEFIAYENLIGLQPSVRRSAGKVPQTPRAQLADAMGAIRRALKILVEREVSPQLGLLKSTLLQLDPTFSERDYGAATFRDFIQKLADGNFVNLKQVDRSLIVELKDGDEGETAPEPLPSEPIPAPVADMPAPPMEIPEPEPAQVSSPALGGEGIAALVELMGRAKTRPRWPFYLRGLKQYLRALDATFDERRYGFVTLHDLIRQGQRENFFRVERNRQGILRIFPGERYPQEVREVPGALPEELETQAPPASVYVAEPRELEMARTEDPVEPAIEQEVPPESAAQIVEVLESEEVQPPVIVSAAETPGEEKPKRRKRPAPASKRKTSGIRKPRGARKAAQTP